MQFCCQVPSSSKLYRWCTVYMSATAPECDIFNLWFIIFDCRMTNYELLHWLVETPSRDVEHYRMSTASRSTVRQFNIWRETLNWSSRPGQQWKRTKRPLPVDPYSNNQISALVAVRTCEGGPGVDHVVVVRLTTSRRSKKRRVRDRETFCTPPLMSKGRFVRMIPTCRRPRFRLNTYGRRAFSVAGPTAWNSLPDFVRDATSSTDFFYIWIFIYRKF